MNGSLSNSFRLAELLDVLRCGLATLVPIVERVGIPWTEGDSYDDWDAISSAIYNHIVVNTVRNATEVVGDFEFPSYDLIYPSYEGMAYFEVTSADTDTILGPFVGFEAIDHNFLKVKYAVTEVDGAMYMTTTQSVIFAECGIRLRLPDAMSGYLEALTIRE